jgi:EAL domain-containing protein (putative c-di-GMP-specific phosphodiesterase class I)
MITAWWWAVLAVLFVSSCGVAYWSAKQSLIEEQEQLVNSLSQKLLAPMVLSDKDYAQHVMNLLGEHGSVLSADLVDAHGAVVASYGESMGSDEFALAQFDGRSRFEQHELLVMSPVSVGGQVLGNIHMRVDTTPNVTQSLGGVSFVFGLIAVLMYMAQARGLHIRVEKKRTSIDLDEDNAIRMVANQRWAHPDRAVDEALKEAGISVRYVPITVLGKNSLHSLEAMVHWQRPTGQVVHVSPAEFVGLAERSGLILPFSEWVLNTAFSQVAHWHKNHGALGLSFNISAQQFMSPTFPAKIRSLCAEYGLPHNVVSLEVHEGVLAHMDSKALRSFEAFAVMGLGLTVDGFGSTAKSHSLLRNCPIQRIKFDKRLMAQDANADILGARMQELARVALSLSVPIMAEGLVSVAQERAMQLMGCRLGQGNGMYQSMSAHTLDAVLCKEEGINMGVIRPWQDKLKLVSAAS